MRVRRHVARCATPAPPRAARVSEAVEQRHVIDTCVSIGGRVWVLGTKRGTVKCQHCGRPTLEHQGTKQTPGVSDLICFVPDRRGLSLPGGTPKLFEHAYVEMKALDGTQSDPQKDFETMCLASGVRYTLCRGLNGFLALCIELGAIKPDNVPHYRVQKDA